ncbi:MAG: carboxymuconolactone decarboxylase family protein [Nitrososphaerales archaeon]|nr:carboxymuconolactone decarboxylase family protein [Nitrososphaerales archaeon]
MEKVMKLDSKFRELVAVGASITANCKPCLEYHVGKARESGANGEEISEAVEVGKMVRRGAVSKTDQFALSLTETTPHASRPDSDECGCK